MSPEARTAELIDAAERLVIEHGADGLSLERVAEAAGCSRNLAYSYFPNLDALIDGLGSRQRQRLAHAVLERIPRPSPFQPWIAAWVGLVLDEAELHGPLLLLLFDSDRATIADRRARNRGTIAGLEHKVTADLGLTGDRARIVARLISGAIVAGAIAVAVDGSPRSDVEEAVLDVISGLT